MVYGKVLSNLTAVFWLLNNNSLKKETCTYKSNFPIEDNQNTIDENIFKCLTPASAHFHQKASHNVWKRYQFIFAKHYSGLPSKQTVLGARNNR